MTNMIDKGGVHVAEELVRFFDEQALPGTGLDADQFWHGFAAIFQNFAPRNRELLAQRDELQQRIDTWHSERAGEPFDIVEYKAFLEDIGYLVPEPAPFAIGSQNVDAELATLAGPQLVVPVLNPAYSPRWAERVGGSGISL
jgi:malate synthase